MTHQKNHTQDTNESQETFEEMLRERLQQAVRTALISVLEEEVEVFIGAMRYEYSERRRDYRNGHYTRSLGTSLGRIDDLPVPRTRRGYHTKVFERYHRRKAELDQTIWEMFINGVSQTRMVEVVESLTGTKPSASTVSRVFHSLESEYEQWKTRKLAARYRYAFADGTYFTVIYNGQECKMPILAVVGINENGERKVLAFRVRDRKNEQAWNDLHWLGRIPHKTRCGFKPFLTSSINCKLSMVACCCPYSVFIGTITRCAAVNARNERRLESFLHHPFDSRWR